MLQSTSLLRGKTKQHQHRRIIKDASIHFPLAREDVIVQANSDKIKRFNPLPSCEGRLDECSNKMSNWLASIHFPLAREDEQVKNITETIQDASIHFPLAREDYHLRLSHNRHHASIHFPLAREDHRQKN